MMRKYSIAGLLLCAVAACGGESSRTGVASPPPTPTLDAQLRGTLQQWGAVPIGAVNAPDPALVDLGKSLFFDKVLSGNRDVACATCHSPLNHTADVLSLSIGTGGTGSGVTRQLGAGRQFTPRNAPTLLNTGLGAFYLFWDGRVSDLGGIQNAVFKTPAGAALPAGLTSVLAAQAMFPVTNRNEMRGEIGDRDAAGNANELAAYDSADFAGIWTGVMQRVLAINGYVAKFNAAFPGVSASSLGFQHAADAIAAFETAAFTFTNSPFDRYLARDDDGLTTDAKHGALLFFGKARCSTCHFGPLLGGQTFAAAAVPQLGPGVGKDAPLDLGQDPQFPAQTNRFLFRVPALRNVELTPPYMHDGAFATLDAVVRHYNNAEQALHTYDVSQLDPRFRAQYHGDDATITAILTSASPQLRAPLGLSDVELNQLVAFLESLTDPAARSLAGLIPASVPSGLPVP
ncbi:MAG TPA: cytochrome c peroxidase [Gemmatimonadaceae bacterium]|jgi:cytochrome c peroxidase